MLKYEINWNRKLASKGWATAAFLHEMIRAAAVGNFANVTKCRTGHHGAWPALDLLLALDRNSEPLEGFAADETGRLTWSVVPVAVQGEWNR